MTLLKFGGNNSSGSTNTQVVSIVVGAKSHKLLKLHIPYVCVRAQMSHEKRKKERLESEPLAAWRPIRSAIWNVW